MRDTSSTINAALTEKVTVTMTGRLTIYKSRIYFNEVDLDSDNAAYFEREIGSTDYPLPEAMAFVPDKGFCTISIDAEGFLMAQMRNHSPVKIWIAGDSEYAITDGKSRPGIFGNYAFFHNGNEWVRLLLDMDAVIAGTEDCVLEKVVFSTMVQPGAIHPLASDVAVCLYIREGSVSVSILNYTESTVVTCPSRFINPTRVLDKDVDEDFYGLHYSGATILNDGVQDNIFVYFTAHDGSMKSIKYSGLTWSDIYVSIPTDLSSFKVGSVFTTRNKVFVCGIFSRDEEFVSDKRYTLFTNSSDGFVFTLDRRTLVSLVDRRFLMAFDDENSIVFSSSNRYFIDAASYQLVGVDCYKSFVTLNSISGSPTSGWTANVKAGSEEHFNDPFLENDSYAMLEIGVRTTVGYEWIKYHDIILNTVKKEVSDGSRTMILSLVPDALWHTSSMTHPFYMEIAGKSGVYDKTIEFNNLYKLSGDSGIPWSFQVDLWPAEDSGDTLGPSNHAAATETDFMSVDLLTLMNYYPEFDDRADYEVKLYGWSRAGKPDTNPNTADPTTTTGVNDDFKAILIVEDDNGIETTIVSDIGDLTSDFANPPQTYFTDGVRDGSYPVVYTMPNPGEGKKLKKVGIRVISDDVETVFYVERVEIPGLKAQYIVEATEVPTFQVAENNSKWALVDTMALNITTGNAADGDQVTSAYSPRAGYCYAVAIVGEVQFERNGLQIIQDSEFYCEADLLDAPFFPPTWTRSYPPGSGPNALAAIEVEASEWPYFGSGAKTYEQIIDVASPTGDHAYLFKHSDTRFKSSRVLNSKIPYFYSNGSSIKVAFFLKGTSTITNIVGGNFTVYLFESPESFANMDFYGGVGFDPTGTFDYVSATGGLTVSDTGTGLTEITASISASGTSGNRTYYGPLNHELIIENNSGADLLLRGTAELTGTFPPADTGRDIDLHTDLDGFPYDPAGNITKTIDFTLANGDQTSAKGMWWKNPSFPGLGSFSWSYDFEITFEVIGAPAPDNPQLPVPSNLNIAIPASTRTFSDKSLNFSMETRQKGVPQILLSTQPYSAFNFEATGRFDIVGEYSYAGIVGLAKDENNFITGYYREGYLGIAKVRDGIFEVIDEITIDDPLEQNKLYDVRFWHRDGLMGVEVKKPDEVWPRRGSMLLYEWLEADGEISASDDIFHVGIYAFINPPKFRTIGHRSSQTSIAVMPLDQNPDTGVSEFITLFPESGQFDIQGVIYNYTGKKGLMYNNNKEYAGPYQLRNLESWDNPFNSDRNGKTYQGGKAVEITQFSWLNGTDHAEDFQGSLMASTAGYTWEIDETQYKVWITTGGQVVWLRNRARHYAQTQPDYYGEGGEKLFISDGLTGVSPVVADETEYRHSAGSFAYIHSEDKVSIHGFCAINGDHDQSIMSLLDLFCKIAGTSASFIGDTVYPVIEAEDGEEEALQ